MGKKVKRKDVDQHLLHALYELEAECKQIHSIMKLSMEPSYLGHLQESLAQAKYIFLLKEAKHRNLRAYR